MNYQNKHNKFETINEQFNMNKLFLTITLLFFYTNILFGQRKTPELDTQKKDEETEANEKFGSNDSWKDKMIYGGNMDVWFSSNYSIVLIQPLVGYKITDKFQVGLNPLYIYNSRTFRNLSTGVDFKLNINAYGPGVFSRYFINENIFAHTEYLGLSYNYYIENTGQNISRFSNSAFVGGGYMPGGSGVYFMALYDLMYDAKTSFYPDPLVVRIGFVF